MKEFWMKITKVNGKQITTENLTDPDQPLPEFTFSEDHGFKVGDKIHMTDKRKYPLPSIKGIAFAAALLATAPVYAGGFGAGFGQGIGQQFGGMPAQPYYYVPPPQPSYQNQMFYPQQQRYTFPNGSLNCTTFQGAFGSQTTCR